MSGSYIPANGGPKSLGILEIDQQDGESHNLQAPGPNGVNLYASPFIEVYGVIFDSDHKKLTDRGYSGSSDKEPPGSFEAGGTLFPARAWDREGFSDKANSFPVSHTGGEKIKLTVIVYFSRGSFRGPLKGNLVGIVADGLATEGMVFRSAKFTFNEGENKVSVTSDKPLKSAIQSSRLKVVWHVNGLNIALIHLAGRNQVQAFRVASNNELFVTMGDSDLGQGEITYERMVHSVKLLGDLNTVDPRGLVEKAMISLCKRFGSTAGGAWVLARNPPGKVDCASLAKYLAAMLSVIGVKGKIEAVIVYLELNTGQKTGKTHVSTNKMGTEVRAVYLKAGVKLEDLKETDFKIVEEKIPLHKPPSHKRQGLNWPEIWDSTGRYVVRLMDRASDHPKIEKDVANVFEGCVKFTMNGPPMWCAGGTTYKAFDSFTKVIHVFRSLVWWDSEKKIVKSVIANYPKPTE